MAHHHQAVALEGHTVEARMLANVSHFPLTTPGDRVLEPIDKMKAKVGGLEGAAVEAAL